MKTLGINENHCAWVARNLKRELSDIERKLVTVVCAALRVGPYDVRGFMRIKSWDDGARVLVDTELAIMRDQVGADGSSPDTRR